MLIALIKKWTKNWVSIFWDSEILDTGPKYILHSPLVDEDRLEDFVERCLIENVSLIAVIGPGCIRIEDIIDEIIVGDAQYDNERFICTTSHPDESYENVLEFVKIHNGGQGQVHEVRL